MSAFRTCQRKEMSSRQRKSAPFRGALFRWLTSFENDVLQMRLQLHVVCSDYIELFCMSFMYFMINNGICGITAFPIAFIDSRLHVGKEIPASSRGSPSSPLQRGATVGKLIQFGTANELVNSSSRSRDRASEPLSSNSPPPTQSELATNQIRSLRWGAPTAQAGITNGMTEYPIPSKS